MFEGLASRLEDTFKRLRGKGALTRSDVEEALKAIRLALLEADVNFKVVKQFCDKILERAVGESVLKSLSPGQQVVKVVHEEMISLLGEASSPLNLSVPPPAIILLVGLQGSGKTTTAAKLALKLKKESKRRPLLVPCDTSRPAAIEQLQTLGKTHDLPVHDSDVSKSPLQLAEEAISAAALKGFDTVILDTAGRAQVDQSLMHEIAEIAQKTRPHETLLVVDSMVGQEAVNVAEGFHNAVRLTGLILTKLDGDARGGAALSVRAVTGCPIKFIGVGERPDALEVFYPDRLASRILGMGDVLSLIEKAQHEITVEESADIQKKMMKGQFTLEDFLSQMKMMKRMGPLSSLAAMIPGVGKMAKELDSEKAEKDLKRIEALILSMTPHERRNHEILNGSRRKRIAKGAGSSVEELNRFLKQFLEMKKMVSQLSKMGLGGLQGMLGGKIPGMGR